MTGESRHHRLSPPLTWIKRRHLGLSDSLIEAVQADQLAPDIAAAARQDPDWATYANLAESDDAKPPTKIEADKVSLPHPVRERIARYGQLRVARFESPPQSGQIVRIDSLHLPSGTSINGFLGTPLFVLLDGPSSEAPDLWYGWVAAGEVEYASYWDLILQISDGPFDPDAGMVQIWNPVWIYQPELGRVVGQLSPERLRAVRTLASDFLTEGSPATEPGRPGQILHRALSNGVEVITGTPVREDDDPRREYQHILFQAAEAVREPARIALRQRADQEDPLWAALQAWWQQVLETTIKRFPDMSATPLIAVPMSTDTAESPEADAIRSILEWPGRARVRVVPDPERDAGRLEVEALEHSVKAEIILHGSIVDHVEIPSGERESLTWEGQATLSLTTGNETRSILLESRNRPT